LEYLVGAGGWAYFPTKSNSQLKAYSEAFNFVEVNYTFYEYPDRRRVESWRRSVPEDFTFSVRCHQELTHKIRLKPTNEAYQVLGKMLNYCRILKAPFLVLETPASYEFTNKTVDEAREFLIASNLKDVRLVWENRAMMTQQAKELMQEMNIVNAVDLSVETPLFPSDTIYTRLFGKGKHNIYQFTDAELQEISDKILMSKAKTAALSYHGVRMYSDALRFAAHMKTGTFPSITPFVGAKSAKAVLSEDTHFPISKQRLIDDQGWKVFDATKEERIHLSEWLKEIPEKVYSRLEEVVNELETKH
jgi:uncharacterized protein YecE (DUF72 family)